MFKICPMCKKVWDTPDEFTKDKEVVFIGFQEDADGAMGNYQLFNHSCKTTMCVETISLTAGDHNEIH